MSSNSHVHSSPPFLYIFSQVNPIQTFPSLWLKSHCNIIVSRNSRCSQWPLTFRFPYSYPVCVLLLCHTPCPHHNTWFYHPDEIWWEVNLHLTVISTQIACILYVHLLSLKCKSSYFSVSLIQYYSALINTAQLLAVGHRSDLCLKHEQHRQKILMVFHNPSRHLPWKYFKTTHDTFYILSYIMVTDILALNSIGLYSE
jgi:hypothetical protein